MVSLLLLLSLTTAVHPEPFDSAVRPELVEGQRPAQDRPVGGYALRQAGVESEPTRQDLSNTLTAGAEEAPRLEDLKVRFMYDGDYLEDEKKPGAVLEIHRRRREVLEAIGLHEDWGAARLDYYADREQAVVVQDSRSNRIAGFLVFERRGGEGSVIGGPESVEILNIGIHPDYGRWTLVEEAMVGWLMGFHPGTPVGMTIHEKDKFTRKRLKKLGRVIGVRAGIQWNHYDDSDGYRFVFGADDLFEPRDLDEEVWRIRNQQNAEELSDRKAALAALEILEEVEVHRGRLNNWIDAYSVLLHANGYTWPYVVSNQRIGRLGEAVQPLLRVLRDARDRSRAGEDLTARVVEFIRRFRKENGRKPSEVVREVWPEDDLWERLATQSGVEEGQSVVVLGRMLADHFLGLQALAERQESVVVAGGDPAETVIRLVERGVRRVRYFGGLEEARQFTAAAGLLQIEVTATTSRDPVFRGLLSGVLLNLGLSSEMVSSGVEEFLTGSEELGRAA